MGDNVVNGTKVIESGVEMEEKTTTRQVVHQVSVSCMLVCFVFAR